MPQKALKTTPEEASQHLRSACVSTHLDGAREALGLGGDIHQKDEEDRGLLHQLLSGQAYDWNPVVHAGDADIDDDLEMGWEGGPPPPQAHHNSHAEMVKFLLAPNGDATGGINPNQADHFLDTPLHYAARNNHIEPMKALLAHSGINVEAQNRAKFTPMHEAAWHGNIEAIRVLLAAGADKDAPTLESKTPIEFAIHHRRKPTVFSMIAAGAVPPQAYIPESFTLLKEMVAENEVEFDAVVNESGMKPASIPRKQNPKGFQRFAYMAYVMDFILPAVRPIARGYAGFKRLASILLTQSEGNWEDVATKQLRPFTVEHASSMRDMVKEFTQHVVLPEYIRRTGDAKRMAAMSDTDVQNVMDFLVPLTAKVLFDTSSDIEVQTSEHRSIVDMLGISERWHARRETILANIRDPAIAQRGAWHPLLPDKVLQVPKREQDGINEPLYIENLTTPDTLKEEGGRLHHCVGSYASSCQAGMTHILSIRRASDGSSISTFEISSKGGYETFMANAQREIRVPHANRTLHVVQHRGVRDSNPPAEAWAALDYFAKGVESGLITLNMAQHGRVRSLKERKGFLQRFVGGQEQEHPPIVEMIGFDPIAKPEAIDNAFQQFKSPALRPLQISKDGAYVLDEEASRERGMPIHKQQRNVSFLPSRFREMDAKEFFAASGMARIMNEMLFRSGITPQAAPGTSGRRR